MIARDPTGKRERRHRMSDREEPKQWRQRFLVRVSCGQICGSGTPSIDYVREFDYDIDAPASQLVAADATAANEQA